MGRHFRIYFILLTGVLAGCSQVDDPRLRHSMPRDVLVQSYALLNENRQARPSGHAAGSAMGMFLKAPERGERGECVATHITRGVVATNAHCARYYQFMQMTDFFVIYYSRKTGQLSHSTVASVIKVGDQRLDDMAFFRIPDKTAEDWDDLGISLEAGYFKYPVTAAENHPKDPAKETPLVHKVTVLGFDPLSSRVELSSFFRSKVGAIFSPKTCYMDRTIPWRADQAGDGSPQNIRKLEANNKSMHWDLHLFFDRCDVSTRAGNSGSAIFTETGELAGFFHWSLAKRDFGPDELYLGSDRLWNHIWGNIASLTADTAIFNVGTVFDYLLNRRYPELRSAIPPV